jgi:hypothetical protein
MNELTSSANSHSGTRRAELLVALPFAIFGLGAAVYGLVRHESLPWILGTMSVGTQWGNWIGNRWLEKGWRNPTTHDRAIVAVTAYLLVVIPTMAATIGFMFLFPNWFPSR